MNNITKRLHIVGTIFRRYVVLLVMIIFGGMYGYLIITSSQQAESTPSDIEVNERFQGISRPKIDKQVAETLQQLEEQNIEIRSIFEEARNNPFTE